MHQYFRTDLSACLLANNIEVGLLDDENIGRIFNRLNTTNKIMAIFTRGIFANALAYVLPLT